MNFVDSVLTVRKQKEEKYVKNCFDNHQQKKTQRNFIHIISYKELCEN